MTTTDVATKWLTLREAAEYARCSTITLTREIRAGRLRAYRLATRRSWRLQTADVDRWISGNSSGDEPVSFVAPCAGHVKGVPR
jgi:excisionase family DNA binding protein